MKCKTVVTHGCFCFFFACIQYHVKEYVRTKIAIITKIICLKILLHIIIILWLLSTSIDIFFYFQIYFRKHTCVSTVFNCMALVMKFQLLLVQKVTVWFYMQLPANLQVQCRLFHSNQSVQPCVRYAADSQLKKYEIAELNFCINKICCSQLNQIIKVNHVTKVKIIFFFIVLKWLAPLHLKGNRYKC